MCIQARPGDLSWSNNTDLGMCIQDETKKHIMCIQARPTNFIMCIQVKPGLDYSKKNLSWNLDAIMRFWLIDCLLFNVLLENLSLVWRHRHYRWRAAKFKPRLGAFEQGQSFLTRGPRATSLNWVILANILHINTCKVTFLYCGPNCSGTNDFNNRVNLIQHYITLQVNLNCFGSVVSWRDFQRLSPLKQM
jgi:hypothetical protein